VDPIHYPVKASENHIALALNINIVARIWWRLHKTGIGLTTGFIGSHTVTHNYSVYTL
jgi:ABC-type uncharacterized transport system permease subunit